jgi:hypothetical protein
MEPHLVVISEEFGPLLVDRDLKCFPPNKLDV